MTVRRRVTLTRPELKALKAAANHAWKSQAFDGITPAQLGFEDRHLVAAHSKLSTALTEIAGESK